MRLSAAEAASPSPSATKNSFAATNSADAMAAEEGDRWAAAPGTSAAVAASRAGRPPCSSARARAS